MNDKICTYIITFPNGKFYIGYSTDISVRIDQHVGQFKSKIHHNKLAQVEWDSHGCFDLRLMHAESKEDAMELEKKLILENVNNPDMLNIGVGYDNLSRNPDREVIIKKMTITMINRYSNFTTEERLAYSKRMTGQGNPMYGKNHTEESIAKIKANQTILRGKDSPMYGRTLSVEARARISQKAKQRTGVNNAFFGKTHSDETKRKISIRKKEYHQNNPVGNETGVIIDGTSYVSLAEAARATGVNLTVIRWRVKSKNKRFDNYQYIEKCPTTRESDAKDG